MAALAVPHGSSLLHVKARAAGGYCTSDPSSGVSSAGLGGVEEPAANTCRGTAAAAEGLEAAHAVHGVLRAALDAVTAPALHTLTSTANSAAVAAPVSAAHSQQHHHSPSTRGSSSSSSSGAALPQHPEHSATAGGLPAHSTAASVLDVDDASAALSAVLAMLEEPIVNDRESCSSGGGDAGVCGGEGTAPQQAHTHPGDVRAARQVNSGAGAAAAGAESGAPTNSGATTTAEAAAGERARLEADVSRLRACVWAWLSDAVERVSVACYGHPAAGALLAAHAAVATGEVGGYSVCFLSCQCVWVGLVAWVLTFRFKVCVFLHQAY